MSISPPTSCLMVRGVSADMLRLVFSKSDAAHHGQISPLWSCVSKRHFSRSLVICSENIANLNSADMFGSSSKRDVCVQFFCFVFDCTVINYNIYILTQAFRV